ncbi:Peptidyl-prolyl cis-trans isomerase cyp6 [Serendipita sp. 405]|nr:Peptidyl-prolyl cis-trans isomerase cyp6 [Serendipita sp. 405]
MSVLLETSLGDIVIDLEVDLCPAICENFLKLCKVYYYNLNAFFNVGKDFIAQVGDPTATGTGGECILSYIAAKSGSSESVPRYFAPQIVPRLKHTTKGTVSMAVAQSTVEGQPGGCGSQFYITLADNIDYLDGKHPVFGHVVEGLDVLDQLNEVFTDHNGRPLKDVRIRHVFIIEDPFPSPPGLVVPDEPPTRPPDADSGAIRIADDEDALAELPEEEAERQRRKRAAEASALTLEMVGDLPFANVRPPENVLFVCQLNSVTTDEDLELIFSRFGKIMSCRVIREKRTGDSLQYAFIEFDKREDAEQAYFKMQNVLIDDRRIWVDLCVCPLAGMTSHVLTPFTSALNLSGASTTVSGVTMSRWAQEGNRRAEVWVDEAISSTRESTGPLRMMTVGETGTSSYLKMRIVGQAGETESTTVIMAVVSIRARGLQIVIDQLNMDEVTQRNLVAVVEVTTEITDTGSERTDDDCRFYR